MVKGSDVRDRILSPDEFEGLMEHSEGHTKGIICMGIIQIDEDDTRKAVNQLQGYFESVNETVNEDGEEKKEVGA